MKIVSKRMREPGARKRWKTEGEAMEGLEWGRKETVVLKTYSTTSAGLSSQNTKIRQKEIQVFRHQTYILKCGGYVKYSKAQITKDIRGQVLEALGPSP